jgi:hypothetical protein
VLLPSYILLVGLASGLRLGAAPPRAHVRLCAAAPPPLPDGAAFAAGFLEGGAAWRQDPTTVQVVVQMPEDASFKRDVSIKLSRRTVALTVAGTCILDGDLAHDVVADESEWYVEDELEGFERDERYLVVSMRKHESFVEWLAPLRTSDAPASRRLLIGGKGEAQKKATAQQLSSYQVLQKLPSAVRGDVYARVPAGADGAASQTLYFVGKVISEVAPAHASLAAQAVLVREHARVYQPTVFGAADDDDAIELWLAPGNTEMRVAQNELSLTRWSPPAADVELPSAGACGFEPETAPPPHMGGGPFIVKRDGEGQPLGAAFQANVMAPDEVPGAYEAWQGNQ